MYKEILFKENPVVDGVIRLADGAFVPFDKSSYDYQAYLLWLDEGNTPEPADAPPPPDPKMVGIEFEGVMCSATRDDQNGILAVIVAYQLQGDAFKSTVFQFVNGTRLTITKENIKKFLGKWMPFRQSFFEPPKL